jgi:hypothetical protein
MPPAEINFLAVATSAVIAAFIHAIWFSGLLFGKRWMLASARPPIPEAQRLRRTVLLYCIAILASLITAYIMANFVYFAEATTAMQGATVGFWLWIGLFVPVGLVLTLFEHRSRELFLINAGYVLVTWTIIGAILAVWP